VGISRLLKGTPRAVPDNHDIGTRLNQYLWDLEA
jgi:hypothetical protein